ncbi:MAG TPA: ATP-binding protein [Gemmataceae bacterium]
MADWRFYGRRLELEHLASILGRGRWFFVQITGRRRIGKTTLVQNALSRSHRRLVFYVQIPDSGDAGVLSAVCDALDTFQVPADRFPRPHTVSDLAKLIEAMARAGYVVVLDEFQYFNRKAFVEFCSLLQAAVDRLAADAKRVLGGLIVLGSIHTEMTALLEDRSAPLYNRVTDPIELTHLDLGSVLAILREHTDATPERLLFLWTLFEGVPKFYRDCFEQQVLGADRRTLLRRIFFESSSPLRAEAENWFLRELRGRYDMVLKFVARHPGKTHGELANAIREASGENTDQIGGYLKILTDRYRLIERKLPIFAEKKERRGRYYLTDNFLQAWLAALANSVAAREFRPLEHLVGEADDKLAGVEGAALEKMAGELYEERSRKGLGDFPLSSRITGYWKNDTEIDMVAVNRSDRVLRFGSCKRSASKLLSDVNNFKRHVDRFLDSFRKYKIWKIEYVGISPRLSEDEREVLRRHDVMPQDLYDLTRDLE